MARLTPVLGVGVALTGLYSNAFATIGRIHERRSRTD
jgi:hypothetical protein